jgi:hypothetical protein
MTCTDIIYVKVDRIKQRFGDGNQGVNLESPEKPYDKKRAAPQYGAAST